MNSVQIDIRFSRKNAPKKEIITGEWHWKKILYN